MYIAIHNKTKTTPIRYDSERLPAPVYDFLIKPGDSLAQLQVAGTNKITFELGGLFVTVRAERDHINVRVEDEGPRPLCDVCGERAADYIDKDISAAGSTRKVRADICTGCLTTAPADRQQVKTI